MDRVGNSRSLLVGALLVAGMILLTWVVVSELRRRITNLSVYRAAAPVTGPRLDTAAEPVTVENVTPPALVGGPPQVSLQLKASEPSVRRGSVPFGKPSRVFGNGATAPASGTGAAVDGLAPKETARIEEAPRWAEAIPEERVETAPAAAEQQYDRDVTPPSVTEVEQVAVGSASFPKSPKWNQLHKVNPSLIKFPRFQPIAPMAEITKPEPESLPTHLPTGAIAGVGGLRHSVESPSFAPQVISTEPLAQQPTTPATMPQPTQPTPAPAIRTAPMTGGAPQPQPASGMHTAVQLTFSFEIASMQLTPSFKMGALQLKPTSKIVTMRLAPSQQPQPAMNLQVTFEIATVQLAGNAIGMIRLTPSQQQRPSVISSPSFNVAGLQLLSGADSGAVQITPSQQGQASVHVTGRFQIATVEFSPSFEIASIVLNSTSKSVSVQLPGAGPSAVEGAPVFEIANVQLAGNGEIGIMQLNAQGTAPKPA